MRSSKTRYTHKSEWKYLIVQEEARNVVFQLDDTGRLVTPLKKRKHRDLKVLMKELGFKDQNQNESSENDEIKDQRNEEKSFKLVFDESILEMNLNNYCDDNNGGMDLTDGYNEFF